MRWHPAPRAEDGRALDVPLLLPFPFQKILGVGSQNGMPVKESATCLEILVKGNILGVRKALPAFTASGKRKPLRRSHCKVNRLPFSGPLVAQEVNFNFPFQRTGLLD